MKTIFDHLRECAANGDMPTLDAEDAQRIVETYDEIHRLQRQVDALRAERDHARARLDSAVKTLVGIHLLLYPSPVKLEDGRTVVFRPKSIDPHEVLQELSDRIRALPDELERLQIGRG